MKPTLSIEVDGKNYTALIAERLLELRLMDKDGRAADFLEITLADHPAPIKLPEHGAKLTVALGYEETGLVPFGVFTHDETEFSYPPRKVVFRCTAINFRRSFNAKRTRSFDNITLGDLVHGIAASHGHKAYVDDSLANVSYPHLDQVGESDMALLTRLAETRDALFKADMDSLIFVPRTEQGAALVMQLGSTVLTPQDVDTWYVTRQDKDSFSGVIAKWQDLAAAQTKSVLAGTEGHVSELPEMYGSEADAYAAASARLAYLTRKTAEVSMSLPGNPNLSAGGQLTLTNFREGVDGVYTVKQVEHVFTKQRGYQSRLTAAAKLQRNRQGDLSLSTG